MRCFLAILAMLFVAGCATVPPDLLSNPNPGGAQKVRKAAKPFVRQRPKAVTNPQKRAVVNAKTGKPVVVGKPVEKPKGRFRRVWDRLRGR